MRRRSEEALPVEPQTDDPFAVRWEFGGFGARTATGPGSDEETRVGKSRAERVGRARAELSPGQMRTGRWPKRRPKNGQKMAKIEKNAKKRRFFGDFFGSKKFIQVITSFLLKKKISKVKWLLKLP